MRRRKRRSRLLLPLAVALTVVIIAGIYLGGRWLERGSKQAETRGDYHERYKYDDVVEIDGVEYRQRKNMTTLLVMGIDKDGNARNGQFRNGGQADFLRWIVIDASRRQVTQLQIDRDTITPITILGVLGNNAGKRATQICLSHGFGDGGEQSCAFTEEAVSELLMGVRIDAYLAMNLDGISVLNDQVGGVTVKIEDDFSSVNPTMVQGATMKLMGDQAEYFVRSRMTIGVGTNEARMVRQQTYITELTRMLDEKIRADKEYVGSLFDALEPYLTTDMSRGRLINEAWNAYSFDRQPLVELPGEYGIGIDGFMEFHVDAAAIKSIVLELFYEPLK